MVVHGGNDDHRGRLQSADPSCWSPAKVSDRLAKFSKAGQMVTADVRSQDGDQLIDHVAIRPGRSKMSVSVLERIAEDGTRMSDHHGVIVRVPKGEPAHFSL